MKFKESEILELKKSTSELKEAVISIAAILNKHKKGELYFGVKNDGTVVRQTVGQKTIRDISQVLSANLEPRVYPRITSVKLQGKTGIYVGFEGKDIPYYAFGRAYMRVGDENKQLSARELENLILEKNKEQLRWDTQICEDARYNDISIIKLKTYLKNSEREFDTLKNALKKLKNGRGGRGLTI